MKATGNTLSFSKGELGALCLFASRDLTRPQINGITVDPAKGLVFSTDGHRILRWAGDAYQGDGMALGLSGFLSALKVGTKKSEYRLTLQDKPLLEVEDATFRLRVTSGTPLNATAVFPKGRAKRHSPVTLQPSVLSGALEACRLLSGIKQCGLSFYPGASVLDPVQLEFDQASEWTALVMPMRGNTVDP